ncbi:anthranilate synthase component 1 [Shewanella sp. JM162201]|uniref:Anthranilate synthase component 1 n=1 Tax=Shewanella jiangmenensis TaxID=2837387 RepID=A0ABS5V7P3_9GAMM|nr:anthranilate synthase component 1 [Shewanella jiangmenensis]MBT1446467.1 anthranilate synthase component 1 [Shewanella jiangmenensis]
MTQPALDAIARGTLIKQPLPYHDDPLALYQGVCQDAPHTLLLESAEIDSKENLKSIIMTHAALRIAAKGYTLEFSALDGNGHALLPAIAAYFKVDVQEADEDGNPPDSSKLEVVLPRETGLLDEDARLKSTSPLDGLRALIRHIDVGSAPGFDDLFLGGVLAYDLIDTVEPLPKAREGANSCPDYLFYLADTLILVDHKAKTAELVLSEFHALAANGTEQSANGSEQNASGSANKASGGMQAELKRRAAVIEAIAKRPSAPKPLKGVSLDAKASVSDEDFKASVVALKEHIIAGDIFQVVPSRSFSLPCPNSLGAYRALRKTNPSPYMFYFRSGDFTLFGASPESALKYDASSNQVEIYPIAGTRKRGKDANGNIDHDLDGRIELELRLDKKELSEHLMLVDLARNDIARISQSGTRKVAELLKVDRYSHVMHLVSRVTGQLRSDLDALHAYQACMNMGTLTGAPKVRASQLIRETEHIRRGSYGGAVGYLSGTGDMDTCIVIRSAFVKDGVAHIQAGAGVVYDSDPQAEADETRQKAQAVISAIKMGGGL